MSDLDRDGSLDFAEFVIITHILFTCRRGIPLPQQLPPSLIPPSKANLVNAPVAPAEPAAPAEPEAEEEEEEGGNPFGEPESEPVKKAAVNPFDAPDVDQPFDPYLFLDGAVG